MIELIDDGTLDTVVRCAECGEEGRYNYDASSYADQDDLTNDEDHYNDFVDWAREDFADSHECISD